MRLSRYLLCLQLLCSCLLVSCGTTARSDKQETAELHMQIAVSHIQRENLPLALKELLIAEDLAPRNAAIQSNLGLVYFLRGRFELAERHYLKSISLRPDFTEAKNNLARVYIESGQYKIAEPYLQDALKDLTFTNYPSIYANYGVLEFRRKRFQQAKVYLKKSLETDRENCNTRVYLGRSYLELNELNLASDELEKAIQLCQSVDIDEAHYYSAITFYRNKQSDRAMVRLEEIAKIFPNGKNVEKAIKMLALIRKEKL